MGLDALGELQMRNRGANGQSHTSFLSPQNGTLGLVALDDDTVECGLASNNNTLCNNRPKQRNMHSSILLILKFFLV